LNYRLVRKQFTGAESCVGHFSSEQDARAAAQAAAPSLDADTLFILGYGSFDRPIIVAKYVMPFRNLS
jgi:hypothetical protein